MARVGDFDKMSLKELQDMETRIALAKEAKRQEERKLVRDEIEMIAKRKGFRISDLFGRGNRGQPVLAKYRDPANPQNTWTGRGRMPRWLVAATKGGKADREAFRIKPNGARA